MKPEFIKLKPPRLLLAPGDPHFPCQDNRALDVMTKAALGTANQLGISLAEREITFTGDFFNSAHFSPHPAVRRSVKNGQGNIEHEKREAEPWLAAWRGSFGEVSIIAGNHEAWGETSLTHGDSPWWEAYGHTLRDVNVYPEGTKLRYGHLVVCHGHDLRGSVSRNSPADVLAQYPGQNTLYGHTHRLEGCTRPTTRHGQFVEHGAWTVGMLVDRAKERADRFMRKYADRHQQGFGLIHFFPTGIFKVELCEIHRRGRRYTVVAAGREYTA